MSTPLTWAATVGAALAIMAYVVYALNRRRRPTGGDDPMLWLASGAAVTVVVGALGAASSLLVDWPSQPAAGLTVGCVLVPTSVLLGRWAPTAHAAGRVLVQTLVACGLVLLISAVYVVVLVGLARPPEDHERTTLLLSILAAVVACVIAFPARRRIEEWSNQRVYGERHAPEEALRTFGSRMSRAVPLDELMLQLVETLKRTLRLGSAELWTGSDGLLTLAVSVPDRPTAQLRLSAEELPVATRAQAQGNKWLQVWVPNLLDGREDCIIRAVAVAHLGELLGMLVVVRPGDADPFTEEEDRVLVDLARQVGLALHNVRLDSALQASLDELEVRNAELVASRARIVAASDESRRRIERNLHDGAQQHLVALAVKVGLARTLMSSDPGASAAMLDELRTDVQTTLTELRDLAHGIYPPLLRDRGLEAALQNAANRATLHTTIDADGVGRYDSDVEAAVYFCCVEAMQNAGKYAGDDARVTVSLRNGTDHNGTARLRFEVHDDGPGFDVEAAGEGHGFVNMRDRLGAIDGTLDIESGPGCGTSIRGSIPVPARLTP